MRRVPIGLIVLACLVMLARPLLSPDLVLLPADLVKHALPFTDEPNPKVQNRLIADVMEQCYPYYSFAREELGNGRFPLWNPYVLNGTPFLATAVSAVLSPLNLLLLSLPTESSYEWAALLKLLLAAAGVLLFLRRLGLSSWGAAVGGAAYAFSGYQLFFLLYPNTAVSMCLGWGLYSVEGLLERVSSTRIAILATVVCVSILGGQPECSLLALMAWTLYALSRSWRRLGSVLIGSMLGVTMAAVVLLPFIELVLAGGTLELRSWAGRNPLYIELWELPALLYPYFLGCPSNQAGSLDSFRGLIYVGLIPLTLAVCAAFSRTWRGEMRALWTVAAASFVILFGIFPFFDLFTSLPLLRNANHLHSALVLQISLAALAGIGVEALSRKEVPKRYRRLILGTSGGVGLIGLALFVQPAWNPDAMSGAFCFGPWRFLAPLYPLLILACLSCLYAVRARHVSVAALILILVNGVLFGFDFNPVTSRNQLDRSNPIVGQLGSHGHDRTTGIGVATLLPNYGMSLGLRDVRGYESLLVKRVPAFFRFLTGQEFELHHFISTLDRQRVQLLQTAGASRVLSPARYDLEGLELIRSRFPYIYLVEGAGRVMLATRVTVVEDGPSALQHVLTRGSFRDTVVEALHARRLNLPRNGGGESRQGDWKRNNRAEWIQDLPGLVELRTVTSEPALLVLRDTYYRGWRAFVDGMEVDIWRTDYLFRGVEVPSGEHTVRFEFRPLSFQIGVAISLLAVLTVLGLLLAAPLSRWRNRGADGIDSVS